ncbi:hypothetical protein ABXJ56_14825 [Microbacterium chocolatum]|uniref:hypothetical protein n=1 Tax=Microbacterium aurantiacum TaxID=162393 RepID=UPI00338F6D1C
MGRTDVMAWVESPLQLLGAAEWADLHGRSVDVAGRLTPQMSETADELVARGARFGVLEPYLGIPWAMLARHGHWLVGDGFSGQFRLAAAVLRPRRLTFLDDGAGAVAYAATLAGERPYRRPHQTEGHLHRLLAPFAHERIAHRAASGDAEIFTAFDVGGERAAALRERGYSLTRHRFAGIRGAAPRASTRAFRDGLGARIILGSARPTDGRMPLPEYREWIGRIAGRGPAVYLPHRRASAAQRAAVAGIDGILVREPALPIEVLLVGTTRPLTLFTLPSSTTTTLPPILAGSGSLLHIGPVDIGPDDIGPDDVGRDHGASRAAAHPAIGRER